MRLIIICIQILLFIACLGCASEEQEVDRYKKLSVEIIEESSKVAFSPNFEEILCSF